MKKVLLGLSIALCLVYLGLFVFMPSVDLDAGTAGTDVLKKYTLSSSMTVVDIIGAAVISVLYVLWACAFARVAGGRAWTTPALATGAGMLAVSTGVMALGDAALNHTVHAGNADAAQALNALSTESFLPFVGALATTYVALGITVLAGREAPKWAGIGSIVLGVVCCLGPGGMIGMFAFPIWQLIASITTRPAADLAGEPQHLIAA